MAASTFYHRVAPQRAAPGTPAEPAKWDEVISRLLDDDMMTVVAAISALILGSSAGGLSEHFRGNVRSERDGGGVTFRRS